MRQNLREQCQWRNRRTHGKTNCYSQRHVRKKMSTLAKCRMTSVAPGPPVSRHPVSLSKKCAERPCPRDDVAGWINPSRKATNESQPTEPCQTAIARGGCLGSGGMGGRFLIHALAARSRRIAMISCRISDVGTMAGVSIMRWVIYGAGVVPRLP